jgi:hypothetical protein
MRSLLVVSCASLLLHVGCGVDPTTAAGAAGGLKAAPNQPKAQSRKAGEEPVQSLSPTSTAKKADDEQPKRKTPPRADKFDGVEGEAQDNDHKDTSPVALDGIDGESQDKGHGNEIDVLETTQRVAH